MYPYRPDPIVRLRIPSGDGGEQRQHKKQPHPPYTVEEARRLVETTRLTFREIGAKIGVDPGTISRWKDKHGWTRPPYSWPSRPRRAGRYVPVLLGRALSQRLRIQAERLLTEIERAPAVGPASLAEASRLLTEARSAQAVRRGCRLQPPPPAETPPADGEKPRRKKSGHDRRAAAELGWRKRYSKREEYHRWMLEKIEERGDAAFLVKEDGLTAPCCSRGYEAAGLAQRTDRNRASWAANSAIMASASSAGR